jgi:hypothetical protein
MNVPKRLPIRYPASTTVKWRRIIGHCRSNTGNQRRSQNANWRTDANSRSFTHANFAGPGIFPGGSRCFSRIRKTATVAMIEASGLPKAPCYFLGRDPLDESIGRVFPCAHDGGYTIYQPYRSSLYGCECESSRHGRTPVAAFFWPPQRNGPGAGESRGRPSRALPMPRGSACAAVNAPPR